MKTAYLALAIVAILVVAGVAAAALSARPSGQNSTTSAAKPIILYVNQGNGRVDQTNFDQLVEFATGHGFNTVFFQIYRSGDLLFNTTQLTFFVSQAHLGHLKIFFALYFTNISEQIPTSIYQLGEDGISLDMSSLPYSTQVSLLAALKSQYHDGLSAVTTTNFTSTLTPDLLILETYGPQYEPYIHSGIIASVGVFETQSRQDYQQQFQYALANSDGVMVFDYAGLVSRGY